MGANDEFSKLHIPALHAPLTNFVVVTLERFSEQTGLPIGVCLGMVNRGYIPTITIGRRRLINMVALSRELARKEFAL